MSEQRELRPPVLSTPHGTISTLDEWREFARRDDCLNHMAPGDLRVIIALLRQRNDMLAPLMGMPCYGCSATDAPPPGNTRPEALDQS